MNGAYSTKVEYDLNVLIEIDGNDFHPVKDIDVANKVKQKNDSQKSTTKKGQVE